MPAPRGRLALVLLLWLASPAAAHLGLRQPPSRWGDQVLKSGPCGVPGAGRSPNVTVLEPGATIDVVWDEYIDHPGHFRIAFDVDGDDDFVDPGCSSGCTTRFPVVDLYSNPAVLLDGIADTPAGGVSRIAVTLPDVECDNCTLQVIQVMYDKPPYVTPGDDIYYQCVDLVLRRSGPSPPPSPSPSPTASVTATASPTPTMPRPVPSATATRTPSARPTPPRGIGDCDGGGGVTTGELLVGIAIALAGDGSTDPCHASFDVNLDGAVTVEELIGAVNAPPLDLAQPRLDGLRHFRPAAGDQRLRRVARSGPHRHGGEA